MGFYNNGLQIHENRELKTNEITRKGKILNNEITPRTSSGV